MKGVVSYIKWLEDDCMSLISPTIPVRAVNYNKICVQYM